MIVDIATGDIEDREPTAGVTGSAVGSC